MSAKRQRRRYSRRWGLLLAAILFLLARYSEKSGASRGAGWPDLTMRPRQRVSARFSLTAGSRSAIWA